MQVRIAMLALAIAGPAWGQAKCVSGSPDVLRLASWKATAQPGGADITVEYENVSGKAVRMVDATAWFRDALGGNIGGAALKRDHQLQPGARASETKRYAGAFERLALIRPQDASAIICAAGVLYEDGERREFK